MSESTVGHEVDKERTKEVIKEFISKYKYLYEKRIQKLVFYSDVYCLVNFQKRLTNATFKPYFWGSYSEDISDILEELKEEIHTEVDFIRGDEVTRYVGSELKGGELNPALDLIISRVHQRTRGKSTDELATFSKQNTLYQDTEFGNNMDFDQFIDDLKNDSQIRAQFSDLKEDIPQSVERTVGEHLIDPGEEADIPA